MNKHKVITQKGLLGIQDTTSKELIIPCENQSAEILCDKYFYLVKEGKREVLNENGVVIFEFKNRPNKNEFATSLGTYNLLCIEEQGETLSFYGENTDPSAPEEHQIHQAVIIGNQLSRKLMTKKGYLDLMQKETGFNVDRSKLKDLIS